MKLAIVHDYLTEMGGAERVVEVLLSTFPDAPLYTSVYDPSVSSAAFAERGVRTTFLQRLVRRKAATKALFPLFPVAFRNLDLSRFDVILSSSSGFAHHVRPGPGALHVCYCYTPPRFLWQPEAYFLGQPYLRRALAPSLAALRLLDRRAAQQVDAYVAISHAVARRIQDTYGRRAEVIYPPVDMPRYRPSPDRSGRFLVVSRLLAYKRVDIVVEAASRLRLPLDVIGEGPDRARLESIAGESVRFLGRQPDVVVRQAMATCVALVLPGSEDFGLTPVEAQASGRPPIAFASGGGLETVKDGETGFLFEKQSWESLAAAMRRAMSTELPPARLIEWARRFDVVVFQDRIRSLVRRHTASGQAERRGADLHRAGHSSASEATRAPFSRASVGLVFGRRGHGHTTGSEHEA